MRMDAASSSSAAGSECFRGLERLGAMMLRSSSMSFPTGRAMVGAGGVFDFAIVVVFGQRPVIYDLILAWFGALDANACVGRNAYHPAIRVVS